jgi:hypothetical protein
LIETQTGFVTGVTEAPEFVSGPLQNSVMAADPVGMREMICITEVLDVPEDTAG